MPFACWFGGHDKEYGAHVEGLCPYLHGNHYIRVRWVCRRCKVMGEDCLSEKDGGTFNIKFGKLEPDTKAWLAGEKSGIRPLGPS